MRLSQNFTLDELTFSDTAERLNIDNAPDEVVVENLKFLCVHVLQKIRDEFGPVIVTSGYRCHQLNSYIGGSKMSQHCRGEAADIKVPSADLRKVAQWIQDNLIFDQLILEAYSDTNPNRGWVHVSITGAVNRKDVLTARFINGRATYSKGLPK